jgi:hypothetical protein
MTSGRGVRELAGIPRRAMLLMSLSVLGIAALGGAIIAGLSVLVAIAVVADLTRFVAHSSDDRPRTDGRPTSRTQLGQGTGGRTESRPSRRTLVRGRTPARSVPARGLGGDESVPAAPPSADAEASVLRQTIVSAECQSSDDLLARRGSQEQPVTGERAPIAAGAAMKLG